MATIFMRPWRCAGHSAETHGAVLPRLDSQLLSVRLLQLRQHWGNWHCPKVCRGILPRRRVCLLPELELGALTMILPSGCARILLLLGNAAHLQRALPLAPPFPTCTQKDFLSFNTRTPQHLCRSGGGSQLPQMNNC